jgi:PAS domain S-box-containing protein
MPPYRTDTVHDGGVLLPGEWSMETVLLIGVTPDDRRTVSQALVVSAYRIIEATLGGESAQLWRAEHPDYVLLNSQLPGTTWMVLLAELIHGAAHRSIAVILLVEPGDDAAGLEAIRQGAQDYLVTGQFSSSDLLHTLRRVKARIARPTDQETTFAATFRAGPILLSITRVADGKLIDVNDAFLTMTGYTREEVIGRTPLEIQIWVDPAQRSRGIATLRQGESIRGGEADFRMKDGSIRTCLVAADRIMLHGEACFLTALTDITERKQTEELLRTLLHVLPVGVWLTDAQGSILFDNPAGAQIWGERTYGTAHFGQFKGWWAHTGQPLTSGDWSLARVLATGQPQFNDLIEIETFTGLRKYIVTSAIPLNDAQGHLSGAVVINEDVTQRYRIEQALRHSEGRFRALANAIPMIVWTAGPEGILTYVNDQLFQYSGLTPEQSPTNLVEHILHPDDKARWAGEWAHAVQAGTDYEIETRIRRSDGVYRWFLTRVTPTFDEQSRVLTWYGTTIDIHDRKLAEEERQRLLSDEQHARLQAELATQSETRALEQAQEAVRIRDIFLSVASHELRNPLTALLGHAQILKGRMLPGKPMTERDVRAVATIADQALRMNRLIESVLNVSRIERGQLQLQRSNFDLIPLLQQVVQEIRSGLRQHNLISSIDAEHIPVFADEMRLEQMLHNLLSNAIKYSPNGGSITVGLARRDRSAIITIADEGIGIPEASLPDLFRRFYRAGNAEALQISGLGVGLYVVKEIVSLHNGKISVASTEGRGTTFTISLPLAETGPE